MLADDFRVRARMHTLLRHCCTQSDLRPASQFEFPIIKVR